jgi:hypothetical protein
MFSLVTAIGLNDLVAQADGKRFSEQLKQYRLQPSLFHAHHGRNAWTHVQMVATEPNAGEAAATQGRCR